MSAICRNDSPRLVLLKSDPELAVTEKQQIVNYQRQRNTIGGKIREEKRRFGIDLICKKLPAIHGSTIALNITVMSLKKPLELRLVLLAHWI